MTKLVDCFILNNEIELFELRIRELENIVDYFVVVDCNYSWQSNKKISYLTNIKERYPNLPHSRIYTYTLPELPSTHGFNDFLLSNSRALKLYESCLQKNIYNNATTPFKNDYFQREYLSIVLEENLDSLLEKEDVIIISDIDEIIKSTEAAELMQSASRFFRTRKLIYFEHQEFIYNTNLSSGTWLGSVALSYSTFLKNRHIVNSARFAIKRYESEFPKDSMHIINDGGFHFTSVGSIREISNKIKSWGHSELNNIVTFIFLRFNYKVGIDLFGRDRPPFEINNEALEYFKGEYNYIERNMRVAGLMHSRGKIAKLMSMLQSFMYKVYYKLLTYTNK